MILDPKLAAVVLAKQPVQQASLSPDLNDPGHRPPNWGDYLKARQFEWNAPFDPINYQLSPMHAPEPNSGNMAGGLQHLAGDVVPGPWPGNPNKLYPLQTQGMRGIGVMREVGRNPNTSNVIDPYGNKPPNPKELNDYVQRFLDRAAVETDTGYKASNQFFNSRLGNPPPKEMDPITLRKLEEYRKALLNKDFQEPPSGGLVIKGPWRDQFYPEPEPKL